MKSGGLRFWNHMQFISYNSWHFYFYSCTCPIKKVCIPLFGFSISLTASVCLSAFTLFSLCLSFLSFGIRPLLSELKGKNIGIFSVKDYSWFFANVLNVTARSFILFKKLGLLIAKITTCPRWHGRLDNNSNTFLILRLNVLSWKN